MIDRETRRFWRIKNPPHGFKCTLITDERAVDLGVPRGAVKWWHPWQYVVMIDKRRLRRHERRARRA